MSKHVAALLVGAIMVIGGLVMYFVFHDVETSVVGLRQAGFVMAVLGVVELAATVWSMIASRD